MPSITLNDDQVQAVFITLNDDQVQAVLNAAGVRASSVAKALGLVTTVEPEPTDRLDPAVTAANTYNIGTPAPKEVEPDIEPVIEPEPDAA